MKEVHCLVSGATEDEEKRYNSSLVCLLPLQENVPQTLDEGNALAQSSEQVHYPCLGSGG